MKKKIASLICATAIVACIFPTYALAHENTTQGVAAITDVSAVAEYMGSPSMMARASYDLTADKELLSSACKNYCGENYLNGTDFRTKGWVNIVDKKSNTGLRHSTTAVVANYFDPQSYKGAVRKEGAGKVSATSDYVHGWSLDRVFWDWIP